MKEIEVKAKIDDLEILKEKLIGIGCNFSVPLSQQDIIFLPIGIEYDEIIKGTPVVRIRNSNNVITLTLKKRITENNELIKLEKEIIIDDLQVATEIVTHMGFHEVLRVNKTRQETQLGDMSICIDNVSELGYFIEVEKIVEDNCDDNVANELFEFLQSLGIDNRITKGYDTLLYEQKNLQAV